MCKKLSYNNGFYLMLVYCCGLVFYMWVYFFFVILLEIYNNVIIMWLLKLNYKFLLIIECICLVLLFFCVFIISLIVV